MSDTDVQSVIDNIIKVVGKDKVAKVFALGTNQDLGAIDDIGRALARKWVNENGKDTKPLKIEKRRIQREVADKEERKILIEDIDKQIKEIDKYNDKLNNPYSLKNIAKIKTEFKIDPELCKRNHPDIFYYFDGITGVKISASMHPAGLYVANESLISNYGIMWNDGQPVCQLDMDAGHDINLVKYDLLRLKSVKVLNKICEYIGIPYPRSYQIDWNDSAVWDDLAADNLAIPQFESR